MISTNEFARICELVTALLNQYRKFRGDCGIADDWGHSRSIERLSRPFISGYFTLAVVGKVSSGKSTFINALLGCKDLLPTGHDQTTCGLTYIEYGNIPEVTITFGDGRTVLINDDIQGKIKPFVSIPEKYHDLPVNHIDEMILGGFGFEEIWGCHEQLEEETLCAKIDKSLLREYVNGRSPSDIATTIHMRFPFSEELKGWRVIDTPGIGAIGGIDLKTRRLLASQNEDKSRVVDAIVFLQNGSQTLDEIETKRFIKEQLDSCFTKSDRNRLFFVLTHSGCTNFLNYKDTKIDFINKNYGERIKYLTYVDSLLYSFIKEVEDSHCDLKAFDSNGDLDIPYGWAEGEWDVVLNTLSYVKRHLRKNGDAFNNDTALRSFYELANFETLKQAINQFAKNEKKLTLKKLIDYSSSDYQSLISRMKERNKLIDSSLSKIDNSINRVEKKRENYNEHVKNIDSKTRKEKILSKFAFIDERLETLKDCTSIDAVRSAINDLFVEVQNQESALFKGIEQDYSGFLQGYSSDESDDLDLGSLDWDSIEQEATRRSTEYEVSPPKAEKHFSSPKKETKARYKHTNKAEKLRQFKALSIIEARRKKDVFLPQVMMKAERYKSILNDEINKRLVAKTEELEQLKSRHSEKDSYKSANNAYIARANEALEGLSQLIHEYGFE